MIYKELVNIRLDKVAVVQQSLIDTKAKVFRLLSLCRLRWLASDGPTK